MAFVWVIDPGENFALKMTQSSSIGSTLILGSQPHFVLPIARSLHQRGIKVCVGTQTPQLTFSLSRFISEVVLLPSYITRSKEFVETIEGFVKSRNIDMIIPSSDSTLVALSENYECFAALAHAACPPSHIVERVVNKPITFEIARRLGIPLPHQYHLDSYEEFLRTRDTLRFPIVVKGRNKSDMGRLKFKRSFKVCFCRNFNELEQLVREKDFAKHHIIQELCTGDDVAIGMLIHRGNPLAIVQDRRLVQLHGRSIMAVSEPINRKMAEWSVTLLREIGWEGIAMVEFKHNRANGQSKLLEVNGRYWGTIPLAVLAGVDFPFYEWQIAHCEQPIVPSSYRMGIRTRWIAGELERLHKLFWEPEKVTIPKPSRLHEFLRFFAHFRFSGHMVPWSIRDPLPALVELIQTVTVLIARDSRKIIKLVLAKLFNFRTNS
jgi:predicted ATP-grasp superfamily ATP-dependent carboligase